MTVRMMTREEAKAAGIEIPPAHEYECGPAQPGPFTIVSKMLRTGGAAAGNGYYIQDYLWTAWQLDFFFRSSPSAIAIAPAGWTRSQLDSLAALSDI